MNDNSNRKKLTEKNSKIRAFIVMPIAKEYNSIHLIIKKVCSNVDITCIRADEIYKPGAIINQIFANITDTDFIIAEVSDGNPNVYYEVGIAHCIGKPSILLARVDSHQN